MSFKQHLNLGSRVIAVVVLCLGMALLLIGPSSSLVRPVLATLYFALAAGAIYLAVSLTFAEKMREMRPKVR